MIPARLILLLRFRGRLVRDSRVAGPYWLAAGQAASPGAIEGQAYAAGAVAVCAASPGALEGQAFAAGSVAACTATPGAIEGQAHA